MTRSRALGLLWLGSFVAWWLLTPLVVLVLVGVSEWFDSGQFNVTVKDYTGAVVFSGGFYTNEHLILLAIAMFAATLQLMLAAPAVPPFRAASWRLTGPDLSSAISRFPPMSSRFSLMLRPLGAVRAASFFSIRIPPITTGWGWAIRPAFIE